MTGRAQRARQSGYLSSASSRFSAVRSNVSQFHDDILMAAAVPPRTWFRQHEHLYHFATGTLDRIPDGCRPGCAYSTTLLAAGGESHGLTVTHPEREQPPQTPHFSACSLIRQQGSAERGGNEFTYSIPDLAATAGPAAPVSIQAPV